MTWGVWALFVVTETALCLSPGPAVLLVLSQTLVRGTGPSVWSNLGVLTGQGPGNADLLTFVINPALGVGIDT